MLNAINDTPIEIEGIQVDVNPIRAEETGTLSDYMKRRKILSEVRYYPDLYGQNQKASRPYN